VRARGSVGGAPAMPTIAVRDWSFTDGNGSFKDFINGKQATYTQLKKATNLPWLSGFRPGHGQLRRMGR